MLGGNGTLLSPVGTHEFSGFINSDLKNYGVELVDPIHGKHSEPVFASILNSDNGNRTIFSYHPKNIVATNGHNLNINDFKLILSDGFHPHILLGYLKEKQEFQQLIFDGGSWKDYSAEILPYVDVALCSSDFYPPGTSSHDEVLNFLAQKGINKVAITRGGDSVLAYEDGNAYEVQVDKTKVVDTLGAGDFFHGAFCYYYQNHSFKESLEKASKIASLSCTQFGTRSWLELI